MSTDRFHSRRRFLQAGGISLALPALESLAPRRARAASIPKRFVLIYQPDGTIEEDKYGGPTWFPRGRETAFDLAPLSQPLAPVKSDLVFIKGVGNYAAEDTAGHGDMMSHCLRGKLQKASIDQVIAEAWKDDGSPFRSLEFGVATERVGSQHSRMSYNQAGSPLSPEPNPLAMFAKLFTGRGGDMATVDRLHARRKSVLDAVHESFKFVGGRISAADRRRLEDHAGSIREIERSLQGMADGQNMAACNQPDSAAWGLDGQTMWHGGDKVSIPNVEKIAEVQQELLILAIQCGLTRVATVLNLRSNSGQKFDKLGVQSGQHGLAHNWWADFRKGQGKGEYTKTHMWRAEMLKSLVERFKAIADEGGGSLLDNSLIVYTSEMGSGSHIIDDIPMVLAGRAGGGLKTGRFLNYTKAPHTNAFISIARLLGVEVTSMGQESTGPLPGLA